MAESINIKDITLPKGVETRTSKTAITFIRGEKKAVLKGRALEITNPIKELGSRVKRYSDEIIQKCHLGSIKAVISGVENSVDLQKILNKYFKSSSKKS
ncbi:MAG: hypothetical protein PHF86_14250 [Candidatus Nanoarchaeia archaeon]|jgi:hypothetical protein|nr:hypothetical protein [Candidatus Nanoarchaeia archaeon]